MLSETQAAQISEPLRVVAQPTRLQILLEIGDGEACVCHLEATLGQRQAYISQHLMALRGAGILTTRREGRFIFYRLSDLRWMDLIEQTAEIAGLRPARLRARSGKAGSAICACPDCADGESGPAS